MERSIENWSKSSTPDFWAEMAPCDHVVQIYEDDASFLRLLESYVIDGLESNECVIVIATVEHLHALEDGLRSGGVNVFELKLKDQYIPLVAKDVLADFMINGWPDEVLFGYLIGTLMARARSKRRRVRAFGEMVALLWAQGHSGATVQLEFLWKKICEPESFCLFCAYPRSGLTQKPFDSMLNICGTHAKLVEITADSKSELHSRRIDY